MVKTVHYSYVSWNNIQPWSGKSLVNISVYGDTKGRVSYLVRECDVWCCPVVLLLLYSSRSSREGLHLFRKLLAGLCWQVMTSVAVLNDGEAGGDVSLLARRLLTA